MRSISPDVDFAYESGRIALKKIVTARQSNGLWKNWTRTGLAALAIWNSKDYGKDKDIGMGDYGDVLESVVQSVKVALSAEKLTDDAVAIGGMILVLTDNGNSEEVQRVWQMMDGWHFDDKRPDFVNYCATMFKCMRAYAKGADETSKARWHAWYDEIRRMSQRTTVTGENEEHCLWVALNVLVKRHQLYWMGGRRSLPGYGKRSKVDNLIIDVDVDI